MATAKDIDKLKQRIAKLESALALKDSDEYELILVRKPEPVRRTLYLNMWNTRNKCHTIVHMSRDSALRWAMDNKYRLATIRIDYEEGQAEGTWVDVKDGEVA